MCTGIKARRLSVFVALALALASCSSFGAGGTESPARARLGTPNARTVAALDQALAEHSIITAGIGIIRDGELVWSRYHGEQSPGVATSAATRFNVASITKTVAAETALRLAGAGLLDLDAPLAPYWVDPDVAQDPRRERLTARMVLNHTTGFPNWRFFRRDRRLAFEHDPGTTYGYSGEGFEYLARAIENKLGEPFPSVVQRMVFDPIGMPDASIAVRRDGLANVARPVDADGAFHGYYCRPGGPCRVEGEFSAADDMVVTVPDYARFLAALMRAAGYDANLARERDRVQTDRGAERLVDCQTGATCPVAQGYGLGLEVADYGDLKVIGHGGSDWSEQSIAYFYEPSDDGVIVFLNAPNRRAMSAMPRILELLDPASPFLSRYRAWLAREVEREQARGG